MSAARPEVRYCWYGWRYSSMQLLFHIPTNMALSVLTLSTRNTVDLPYHMECVLTSLGVNLTCGPAIWMDYWGSLVILVLLTEIHLLFWDILDKGVWQVVPWCWRYTTRIGVSATSHALGCLLVPYPMYSPLNPFFLSVNRRLKKVTANKSWGVEAMTKFLWVPMNNWMSLIRNDVEIVSVPP